MNKRRGFTVVEVSLVLAVSGLLLVGIIAGLSSSVASQRYNDVVQDFAEYLRTVYSVVENSQGVNDSGGTSDEAYYGKVVLFGSQRASVSNATMCEYSVYGKAEIEAENLKGNTKQTLALSANGARLNTDSQSCHTLPWSAGLETSDGGIFGGMIYILRSPDDSAVHTYVVDGSVADNSAMTRVTGYSFYIDAPVASSKFLRDTLGEADEKEVNFCINSDDLDSAGGTRRDVRLAKDGHNSTAVQLIDVDSEENVCRE